MKCSKCEKEREFTLTVEDGSPMELCGDCAEKIFSEKKKEFVKDKLEEERKELMKMKCTKCGQDLTEEQTRLVNKLVSLIARQDNEEMKKVCEEIAEEEPWLKELLTKK